MKYKVGDLISLHDSGLFLYLVVEIKNDHYYVRETKRDYFSRWPVEDSDKNKLLEKVN